MVQEHFREPFREFKPERTRYFVHKLGYWRICIPHERHQACGNNVLWDDIPTWPEAMAICNQVFLMSWAANYNHDYYSKGRCWW